MKPRSAAVTCLLLLVALATRGAEAPSTTARWGAEALADIRKGFHMPDRSLYAEMTNDGKRPSPAWIWDASIQLGALCAAARIEPQTYLPQVMAYATALRRYRTTNHDRPGLDVNPPPKKPDRYYDDNAWISLSLLEAYELTKVPKDLALATEAFQCAMSGEDQTLGGGIYWHEDQTKSKNACSSGPAMLAALKLHQITGDAKYLETVKRLYDWTRAKLQDEDGLVFDAIRVPEGTIDKAKYTYNSATLLRASCLLYEVTHEQRYLDEARRIAKAAEKKFVRERDGVITGSGKLGVKLVEAFLELYRVDHDDHWAQVVARCLVAVHGHRNENGWYAQDWQVPPLAKDKPARLIDQAAPARAYWVAAERGVKVNEKGEGQGQGR